jgi:regulator of protease activity HflC (stomatin/prohibitin superfamily)
MLRSIAYRAVTAYMASQDMLAMISEDRGKTGRELQKRIQAGADAAGLGLEIRYVGVAMIHPTPETAKSFEEVCGSVEEMHSKILDAEAERLTILPEAEGRAAELVSAALADKARRTKVPEAEAELFRRQMAAHVLGGASYKARKYYDVLVQVLKDKRKYIVPRLDDETIIIDQKPGLGSLTEVELTGN